MNLDQAKAIYRAAITAGAVGTDTMGTAWWHADWRGDGDPPLQPEVAS